MCALGALMSSVLKQEVVVVEMEQWFPSSKRTAGPIELWNCVYSIDEVMDIEIEEMQREPGKVQRLSSASCFEHGLLVR